MPNKGKHQGENHISDPILEPKKIGHKIDTRMPRRRLDDI